MNITEIIPWLVLGFAPTLISMEVAWRMGKIIGKRGEKIQSSSKRTEEIKA
jgi:hypothetical protein